MKKKDYAVYSLRVANELVKMGFKVINSGINIKYPTYKVFYFEDTEALRSAITKINSK